MVENPPLWNRLCWDSVAVKPWVSRDSFGRHWAVDETADSIGGSYRPRNAPAT